jgi:hypothetical protein
MDIQDRLRVIGTEEGLSGTTLEAFVWYVSTRFPAAVESYQREWARRFANGIEFQCSDYIGQAMLRERGYVFEKG